MFSIEFDVPGDPVGKGRPRISTRGGFARAYTPAKTADYEAVVRSAAMVAMSGQDPATGPLRVVLEACKGIPKSWSASRRRKALEQGEFWAKPDIDNVLKIVLDSMNGIIYIDDGQIVIASVSKRYSDIGRVGIRVTGVER